MTFPSDWVQAVGGGLRGPSNIRSARVFFEGTTTTAFEDNAYAFRDLPGAVAFKQTVITDPGDETAQIVLEKGPTGGRTYKNHPSAVPGAALILPQLWVHVLEITHLLVPATGTLTLTANVSNLDQVEIDGKTYTFQTVLTDVDGNVLIGATASDSIDNLIAAINQDPAGSGTLYAASTVRHPTVTVAAGAGDTMVATADAGGAGGNTITTTDPTDGGAVMSWGGATLSGGEDGSGLEVSFDGVTIHSKIGVGTTAQWQERYEAGICIRSRVAGVLYRVEGW